MLNVQRGRYRRAWYLCAIVGCASAACEDPPTDPPHNDAETVHITGSLRGSLSLHCNDIPGSTSIDGAPVVPTACLEKFRHVLED
jgi:hypothetical protein